MNYKNQNSIGAITDTPHINKKSIVSDAIKSLLSSILRPSTKRNILQFSIKPFIIISAIALTIAITLIQFTSDSSPSAVTLKLIIILTCFISILCKISK